MPRATQRDMNRRKLELIEGNFNQGMVSPSLLEKFANGIAKRAWFKNHPGLNGKVYTYTVTPHGDRYRYMGSCFPKHRHNTVWEIELAGAVGGKLDILHSLAHMLVDEEPAHGTEFIKVYMELVRRYFNGKIDEGVKRKFKQELMKNGIKTKVVSEETRNKQRAAWVQRNTPSEEELLETLRRVRELE